MRVKENFILRKVADAYLVIAVGKAVKEFNGMISLNESGAFLWKMLESDKTEDDLVNDLTNRYSVEESLARQDVKSFITKLQEAKLVK